MPENVLKKIINTKSEKILELKKTMSLETLEESIKKDSSYFDFKILKTSNCSSNDREKLRKYLDASERSCEGNNSINFSSDS